MDDKMLQTLTILADKLGTTSEYLWGVLIQQALISGIIDTVVTIWLVGLISVTARHVWGNAYSEDPVGVWADEAARAIICIVFLIVCFIAIVITIVCLTDSITALFNPEFWALNQLLKRI